MRLLVFFKILCTVSKKTFQPPHRHSPDVSEWEARLGYRLVNGFEEFEKSLGVVSILFSQMTGSNIAILQLAEAVSYNDYIQPVCLDISNTRSFPVGSQCWVAGWDKRPKRRGKVIFNFSVCSKVFSYSK